MSKQNLKKGDKIRVYLADTGHIEVEVHRVNEEDVDFYIEDEFGKSLRWAYIGEVEKVG